MFDGLISRWTSPAPMSSLEPVDDFQKQPGRVRHAQRPVPVVLDEVEEALSRDVLEHHEMNVTFAAHRQRAGEVRMRAALGELHLTAKPSQRVLFLDRLSRRKHLDCDLVAPIVDCQKDLAHPPFTNGPHQTVAAQDEPARGPGEELLRLIGRQPSALDQPPRQSHRRVAGGLELDLAANLCQHLGRNQPRRGDMPDEVVQREHRAHTSLRGRTKMSFRNDRPSLCEGTSFRGAKGDTCFGAATWSPFRSRREASIRLPDSTVAATKSSGPRPPPLRSRRRRNPGAQPRV